ncbi:hypothetical protein [Roseobacter sp.]|uniref:hypothetical protein n=1 Tax=Roseobacter sp. TaxID=1907202 RepID=UPI0025D56B4A|nr:hypothetical protein [Roseobacter sp.]
MPDWSRDRDSGEIAVQIGQEYGITVALPVPVLWDNRRPRVFRGGGSLWELVKMLHFKRLQAPAAFAALTFASACAVSDTTEISRAAQLNAALAAVPLDECSYTIISYNLAEKVMAQPDGDAVMSSLSQVCPGIRIGLQETDGSFRTASTIGNDGLTEPSGDGGTGGGDGGTGSGDGGTGSGDGGTGSGDGGTGGDGNNGGGRGGNNGGGNGSEGNSPGRGSGANNDE